jgi:hypothetical protein
MRDRAELPIETDPFLVQIVAVGVGQDLRAAIETATGGLRKRATLLRTKLGFPMIHGMSLALTSKVESIPHKGEKPTTTATLAAWYHLDLDQKRMTPLSHRYVGNVATGIIEEYDVVFCEGY